MNLDFSDDQKEIKASLAKLLADNGDALAARAVLNGEDVFDRKLYKRLAEAGWLGVATPEAYGGSSLGPVMLCGMSEEFGRSLAAIPLTSMYLASEAIQRYGREHVKETYLRALVDGTKISCFAFSEGLGQFSESAVKVKVRGDRLYGIKNPVADGMIADIALVVARGDLDMVGLYLAELSDPGVTRRPLVSLDPTRSQAELRFDGVPCHSLAAGWRTVEELLDRAAVQIAFEQIGGAERCLEKARDYALTRVAFGRPIGAFQAIKHKLANVYITNELARSNAYFFTSPRTSTSPCAAAKFAFAHT